MGEGRRGGYGRIVRHTSGIAGYYCYPIGWRGSIFRGFSPTLRPATTKTTRQVATNPIIYSSIGMPRNKISDDLDHVREDSKPTQPPKQPPPRPWPLLKYTSVTISNALTHGQGYLSNTVASDDPYAIFSLFFSEEVLEGLV